VSRRVRKVAVVIPAYNEAGAVARVVRGALRPTLIAKVIVVDDGSRDGTSRIARRAGAEIIRHARNRGVGAALRTGFAAARKAGADTIVVMGGDNQDVGREIGRLLRKIEDGFDFVQGSRWLAKGKVVNMPKARRIGTKIYSLIFSLITRTAVTDGTNGFRAFRAALLDTIRLRHKRLNRYELEPYLYYHAIRQGYRVAEVAVTKRYPPSGGSYTKMIPFLDWWRIFRPLPMLAFGIWKQRGLMKESSS
jgi:dolichol-phosphate mannosyltransferase